MTITLDLLLIRIEESFHLCLAYTKDEFRVQETQVPGFLRIKATINFDVTQLLLDFLSLSQPFSIKVIRLLH